jgi:hypothetical protein
MNFSIDSLPRIEEQPLEEEEVVPNIRISIRKEIDEH